jgi:histidine triad (HIT) family protein
MCLFCKIVEKKIPAKIIYEDESVLAFEDIQPEAPVHFLVIPKKHIASLFEMQKEDEVLIGHLAYVAQMIAQDLGCTNGFRLVNNCMEDGGQTVFHIHMHILGKRQLAWPPG